MDRITHMQLGNQTCPKNGRTGGVIEKYLPCVLIYGRSSWTDLSNWHPMTSESPANHVSFSTEKVRVWALKDEMKGKEMN